MKNKAFTLMEVLSIIVIIAVIALITVPLILNDIDDSEVEEAESSALGYADAVEKQVVENRVNERNLINEGEYTKTELSALGVQIKSKIDDALVVINDQGKVTSGKFCINGYSIDYDGKDAKANRSKNYCDSMESSLNSGSVNQ